MTSVKRVRNATVLVERLRKEFQIPLDTTDDEVLDLTKGSMLRAFVELRLSWEDLVYELSRLFRFVSDRDGVPPGYAKTGMLDGHVVCCFDKDFHLFAVGKDHLSFVVVDGRLIRLDEYSDQSS